MEGKAQEMIPTSAGYKLVVLVVVTVKTHLLRAKPNFPNSKGRHISTCRWPIDVS